jgi:beta-1,3-glucuronyltransferase
MRLILVTITYERPGRMAMMEHLKSHLDGRDDVDWVVVEDSDRKHPELEAFLPKYSHHLNFGPTRDKGNEQRNLALQYIHGVGLKGIVYNADDDNKYDPALFDEIKKTKRLSVFPVGNLGPNDIERPIVVEGKFKGWEAGWTERKFPVDMAGFAFHSDLLGLLESPFWSHRGVGGESEFIENFIKSPDELEFLCNGCSHALVWHNELNKTIKG